VKPFAPAPGRILDAIERPNAIDLDVETSGQALLVVSVTRHKYWKGILDGLPVGNALFRALVPVKWRDGPLRDAPGVTENILHDVARLLGVADESTQKAIERPLVAIEEIAKRSGSQHPGRGSILHAASSLRAPLHICSGSPSAYYAAPAIHLGTVSPKNLSNCG